MVVSKEGMLTTYIQVVNHLLETQASNNKIAKSDREIVRFTQPTNTSLLHYADALMMRTLRCPQLYVEYVLKGPFLEGLQSSIRHNRASFLSHDEHAALQNFPYEVTSSTNVQEAT